MPASLLHPASRSHSSSSVGRPPVVDELLEVLELADVVPVEELEVVDVMAVPEVELADVLADVPALAVLADVVVVVAAAVLDVVPVPEAVVAALVVPLEPVSGGTLTASGAQLHSRTAMAMRVFMAGSPQTRSK
jgi:hypothetical protein